MTTKIEVAVNGSLAGLSNGSNAKVLGDRVRGEVGEMATHLGLTGDVEVAVTSAGNGRRPLRVLVNSTPAPFPPDLLAQLWMERSDYWDGKTDASRSTRTIVGDCLEAQCGPDECTPDAIATLVVSQIRDSAALLVDDEQAARFADVSRRNDVDRLALRPVLSALLDLGVAPCPPEPVLDALTSNENRFEDSLEAAFAVLQGQRIEVRVSAPYRSILTDTAEAEHITESATGDDAKQLFAAAEERLAVEWAIVPPDLVWKTVDGMRDRTIVIRVNDRLSPEIAGLNQGECVVSADGTPPELDVKRTILNPANPASRLSVVDSSLVDQLNEPLAALTPAGFAALVVYRELICSSFRLVGNEQTLFLLQDLEARSPELVHLILRHFTVAEITQLLRALVRERIPPRLLPVILERLARLVIHPLPPEVRAEFVRRGLSSYVFHRFLGVDAALGRTQFQLSPAIEEGLAAGQGYDHLYAEHIRDALWSALRGTGIPPMRAAVVARKAPRDVVYGALAAELPDIVVLRYSELKPGLYEPDLKSEEIPAPVATAAFPLRASA
jgi:hypothetical protein